MIVPGVVVVTIILVSVTVQIVILIVEVVSERQALIRVVNRPAKTSNGDGRRTCNVVIPIDQNAPDDAGGQPILLKSYGVTGLALLKVC